MLRPINLLTEPEPGSVVAYDAASGGESAQWGEIGSCNGYIDIHRRILVEKTVFDPLLSPPVLPLHVGAESTIERGARWRGFLEVGRRVTIERDVVLEECIVLDGTVVASGSRHRCAVIYGDTYIEAP